MNALFFGDCLDVLREHVRDESVDLIYLDPPFNSKRDYSVLFKTPKGHEGVAQITAFEDSWHWGEQAEREDATIGLFVTLTPPTRSMKTEAVSASFYDSSHHGNYPRVQIFTLEGHLKKTERGYFLDMKKGEHTFKKAARERKRNDQETFYFNP